ncbi:hypothetical protein F4777DRAFT_181024 [Nemania sp. FL0916]|nr:hypothetical protein F4777DRAFT_181024 [Nemania sp. FL0916]
MDDTGASVYTGEDAFSEEDHVDCPSGDFDIATSHMRNEDLFSRDKVKEFVKSVGELRSFGDPKTRKWLARLPLDMCNEVIPLFKDESSSTDYQLHPSFTNLPPGNPKSSPHPNIFCLSVNSERVTFPVFVMGIGRLFVNAEDYNGTRVSKWTGYEVFADSELALWMVFDDKARIPKHNGWYQLNCGLVKPPGEQQEDNGSAFGFAKFCRSLRTVLSASFDEASALIKQTKYTGTAKVDQIESGEVEAYAFMK